MQINNLTSLFPAELTMSHIVWSVGLATGFLVGTVIVSGIVVVFLPPHYFVHPPTPVDYHNSLPRLGLLVGKNLMGIALIGFGFLLLVLPGPGVLTMLIGLMLLSFPGKRKLAAGIIRRLSLLPSVNRLRARFGKNPLILGDE